MKTNMHRGDINHDGSVQMILPHLGNAYSIMDKTDLISGDMGLTG